MPDTFLDLLGTGSLTLWVLITLSALVLALGLERTFYTLLARRRLAAIKQRVIAHLQEDKQALAQALVINGPQHPASALLQQLLDEGARSPSALRRAHRQILRILRRGVWLLGSIGALAPFVGLFGTVLGVMSAFGAMGTETASGFSGLSQGIGEALITTAAGILVSIEAVLFFNYLSVAANAYAAELGECLEEISELNERQPHGQHR